MDTTGAARAVDSLTFPTARQHGLHAGQRVCGSESGWDQRFLPRQFCATSNGRILWEGAPTDIRIFDGTTTDTKAGLTRHDDSGQKARYLMGAQPDNRNWRREPCLHNAVFDGTMGSGAVLDVGSPSRTRTMARHHQGTAYIFRCRCRMRTTFEHNGMTTANDLVKRALTAIGLMLRAIRRTPEDFNDGLETLNEMLETWSNATFLVPYITEAIFTLQNNTRDYTIGQGGTIGGTFTGALSLTTLTVSAIPLGNIALGQYITGAGVTNGTQIVAFLTGAGGIGTYRVNISYAVPIVAEPMQTYYQRPLRINSAFVRVSTLDYPVFSVVCRAMGIAWPENASGAVAACALLFSRPICWKYHLLAGAGQGEMQPFPRNRAARFVTLADVVNLPQGYAMAIRWNLAELLMPEYGKSASSDAQVDYEARCGQSRLDQAHKHAAAYGSFVRSGAVAK